MFPFLNSRPSIFLGEEDHEMLKEIGACLGVKSFLAQINLTLTSVLGQTISTSTITLDQQLPARLESYLITSQLEDTWPSYVSRMSLKQWEVDSKELEAFAQPLVIESKEEKQYQVIKTQSNRQVGFQQKKEDGLLSNQIVNTKKDSRSISPQPMSMIFAQSHAPESQIEQLTHYNPNSSYQSSGKQQVWNEKPQEKILFQDRYIAEESRSSNRIIVKKSDDPQFFQQLKNARIASPCLRQVKGSGLSPEPQIKSKSKSPEIVQVNLPKNCKKWESNQVKQDSQKQVQPIKQPSQVKLPDHFKKLLNDSNKRQNMPKPFDSNNTKFSQKQQEIAQQINQAKTSSFLGKQQLEDSLTDNQNSIPQDKQLPFKISYQEDLLNSDQFRSKSQNKKYESEKLLEQFKTQNQSIRDQFSFKPQQLIEQPKIKGEQLVESKSLRGVSPQNRSIKEQHQPPIQQKEPIQIKLDIKQFMNSNKPHSPIQMARENGRNLYVNVNFHK